MALIILIYLAFISLGLPDGVLGSIWPIMRMELGLPLAGAGILGTIVSMGTIVSALSSYRMISRFGTARVTVVSILLTAGALMGYSVSTRFLHLMLFSIPLGLGAGSVDSALNNYAALHFEAKHMNWLHSCWGIGASTGPSVMALFLGGGFSYRAGYRMLAIVQLTLAFVLAFSIKLFADKPNKQGKTQETARLKLTRHKALPYALGSFFLYCALEVSVGLWAVSYLVEVKHLAADQAAIYGSLFYLGITGGRMLCGFLSMRLSNTRLIFFGLSACLASLLLLLVFPLEIAGYPLLLVGFGCAPVFPGLMHETPRRFTIEESQRIVGLQMACAYVGSTLSPPVFGLIGGAVGLVWMPVVQLIILALLVLSISMLVRLTKVQSV